MLEQLERIAEAWTERGTRAGAPDRGWSRWRWQWSDVVREACKRLIEQQAAPEPKAAPRKRKAAAR